MKHSLIKRFLVLVLLLIALVVFPFIVGEYYVDVMTLLLINAILVVSFRYIALMGEYSFAHIALMGAGAYTSAILTTRYGWPLWFSFPLAGLVPAIVAFILSYPLLRMKGFYFFIGSFAAGEVMRLTWLRFSFFGAQRGIERIPVFLPYGINFGDINIYYYFTLVVTVLCLLVLYRLERSRMGFTIKSIASQDFLANSVGINVWKYKALAFATGSFFTGIAGALFVHRLNMIDAFQFTFPYNLRVLVWAIFGGLGNFAGPLIGLATLTGVEEFTHYVGGFELWSPFIYGAILITSLLLVPNGIISLPRRISTFLQRLHMRRKEDRAI